MLNLRKIVFNSNVKKMIQRVRAWIKHQAPCSGCHSSLSQWVGVNCANALSIKKKFNTRIICTIARSCMNTNSYVWPWNWRTLYMPAKSLHKQSIRYNSVLYNNLDLRPRMASFFKDNIYKSIAYQDIYNNTLSPEFI